jgi:hypothetical protein
MEGQEMDWRFFRNILNSAEKTLGYCTPHFSVVCW